MCALCRCVVIKLFRSEESPGCWGIPRCRRCAGITYLVANCGGNAWYRMVARPAKRLLRERGRLMESRLTTARRRRLGEIEDAVITIVESATSPPSGRLRREDHRAGSRRRYRDVALALRAARPTWAGPSQFHEQLHEQTTNTTPRNRGKIAVTPWT